MFLQVCNGIYKNSSENNEIEVEKEVSYLFEGHNYDLKVGMKRGFANYYNVFIPKSDLSLSDFEMIKIKIEKNGSWFIHLRINMFFVMIDIIK